MGAIGTSVPAQPMRVPGFDPNEQYEHTNQQLFGSAATPTNQNSPYGTKAAMAGFAHDFTMSSHWNPGDENADQHHQIVEAYTPDQLPILNGLAKSYAVSDAWFSSVPTETTPNRAFSSLRDVARPSRRRGGGLGLLSPVQRPDRLGSVAR